MVTIRANRQPPIVARAATTHRRFAAGFFAEDSVVLAAVLALVRALGVFFTERFVELARRLVRFETAGSDDPVGMP